MEFERCPKCGQYGRMVSHKCPPKWKGCARDHNEEYEFAVYAVDAEEAAEKVAESYDEEDHEMMGGLEIEVVVEKVGSDETKTFKCSGEPIPTYYATEKATGGATCSE